MNYRAFFKSLNNIDYKVEIITNSSDTQFKELHLVGEQPVVVNYESAKRLFDPIRTSNCTVNVLTEDYPIDIYSSTADGTKVILYKGNVVEWVGYVQPSLYSQGYSDPIENLEIECSDYLSALQYMDYAPISGNPLKKGIVSFKQILEKITDCFDEIDGYYWPLSQKMEDGRELLPEFLYISEENFFSTEGEPWKMDKVLFEMMQYLGLAIYQEGTNFYISDFADRTVGTKIKTYHFVKDRVNQGPYIQTLANIGQDRVIDANAYRLTGGDMSIDDTFNKITVRDNFYNIGNLLPELFDNDLLRNLNGEYDKIFYRKAFLKQNTSFYQGECWYKFWEHRNNEWKQHLYVHQDLGMKPNEVFVPEDKRGDCTSMMNFISPALIDYAYKLPYDESSKIDFKKYLVLCQNNTPYYYLNAMAMPVINENEYVPLIDTEAIAPIIYGDDAFLVLNCDAISTFYIERPYLIRDNDLAPKKLSKGGQGYVAKYEGHKLNGVNYRPCLICKLRINGEWWNGTDWQTTECIFEVDMTQLSNNSYFNTEYGVKNKIEGDSFIGYLGYRITLPPSTHTAQDIYFGICQSKPLVITDKDWTEESGYVGNAETWISSIDFKIVRAKQQLFSDDDVIYENVIDERNVIDGPKIECKFTTDAGRAFSYSNVAIKDLKGNIVPLKTVKRNSFNTAQKPEENIVESYYRQYSTPSIKENVTISMDYSMNDTVKDLYWDDKNFQITGREIDYQYDRQTVSLLQMK